MPKTCNLQNVFSALPSPVMIYEAFCAFEFQITQTRFTNYEFMVCKNDLTIKRH